MSKSWYAVGWFLIILSTGGTVLATEADKPLQALLFAAMAGYALGGVMFSWKYDIHLRRR